MSTPLTGLTASVTLPSGVNANIYDAQLEEQFREKNAEGFVDAGFGSGILTGQRLHGVIVGWLSTSDPGISTMHSNVPISFTASNGCVISGNFNITRLKIRMSVGQVSIFTADVASVGQYTKTWTQS
ncbi:MAG TPA: hypothetical protein VKJ65_10165 [Phycisphaerae bacterium]|nr:hypothetical protein [Phycisphaerae bacterium]